MLRNMSMHSFFAVPAKVCLNVLIRLTPVIPSPWVQLSASTALSGMVVPHSALGNYSALLTALQRNSVHSYTHKHFLNSTVKHMSANIPIFLKSIA